MSDVREVTTEFGSCKKKKEKKENTFSAPIIVCDQTTDQATTVWDPNTSLQTEIQMTEMNDLKVCNIWLNFRFLY